jgi:hypothetical protein
MGSSARFPLAVDIIEVALGGEVLAPSVAAHIGQAAAEGGMRSCQGRGGAESPRSGPTPCSDGVLIRRGTGVIDDGHNAA